MNGCDETRDRLQDYVDNLLSKEDKVTLEAHLGECLSCRRELRGWRDLLAQTDRLPRSIEPPRDLWPAIAARLGDCRQPHRAPGDATAWWKRPTHLLAAAAAVVAVTAGVTALLLGRPGTVAVPPVAHRLPAVRGQDTVQLAELARYRDGFTHVRRDLLTLVGSELTEISPETVILIEQNMRIIDTALGDIQRALMEDPDNRQLNRLMAATYRREAELVRQLTRSSANT